MAKLIFCYNKDTNIQEETLMLFRCMMITLLLILSVMPVWAGEKDLTDQEIQNDITSNALYHISLERINAEQSPLSKIQTDMKLQRKGDTYYLHYTFTNPTDTHIEKTLHYADVLHSVSYPDKFPNLFTQRCEKPTKFDLPPHASTTVTLALTHKEPFLYLSPSITTFYFTDDSLSVTPQEEAPLVLMKPIILHDSSWALSVENTSPTETIKEIRDCYLFVKIALHDGDFTEWIYQNNDPITLSLDLKPKSTVFIPLQPAFNHLALNPDPNTNQRTQYILIPMPDVTAVPPTAKSYYFSIDAQINNIPHQFIESVYSQDPTRESVPSYNTSYSSSSCNAHWKAPHTVDITQWNEIEDKKLRIYYHIVNPYDITIPMNDLIGSYFISYVTKNALLSKHHYDYPLPPNTTLPPHGELR
ncbi:MAG: hypothetical protein IIX92_01415, partial [Selenomonadales bacterium]|nr:hypothetical protein [Selenomonadales bacterium]